MLSAGTAENPNLPSDQPLAGPSPDPADEWITLDKSQARSYICGYLGCDMSYLKRHHLIRHLIMHTGTSSFRCPHPKCADKGVSKEYFRDSSTLRRHIVIHSLEKPFQCERCDKRLKRKDILKSHWENLHSPETEKKSPKRKKK